MSGEPRASKGPSSQPPLRETLVRAGLVCIAALFWVTLFWVQPARDWPVWAEIWSFSDDFFREYFGIEGTSRWAVKSLCFVVVPVLALNLSGRSLRQLGLGRPERGSAAVWLLGSLVAAPWIYALAASPGARVFYREAGALAGLADGFHTVVVLLCEHVFIQGAVLATALPHGFDTLRCRSALRPSTRLMRLVWVPPAAWPAVLGQAVVFASVHLGKATEELLLSLPGGVALGWVTVRCGSVWPGVALHLLAALAVFGLASRQA